MVAVLEQKSLRASVGHDKLRLRDLIRTRSLKKGSFTLSSGRSSSLYFNMKATLMHPEGAHLAATAFLDLVWSLEPEYVGGLEMGAVPTLGAMAALSRQVSRDLGTFFIRKKPKEHGTRLAIEGLAESESLAGHRVVIIDDVTTTGESVLKAVHIAREEGATVEHAVSLVDREEGAQQALSDSQVQLHSVFVATDFT